MNDRELLELAAKAAGFYVCNDLEHLGLKEWGPELWVKTEKYGTYAAWNPLTDDGDAFRLAVTLRLDLTFYNGFQEVHAESSRSDGLSPSATVYKDDVLSAARRAIVMQAATL